jgi:hypothetical protein
MAEHQIVRATLLHNYVFVEMAEGRAPTEPYFICPSCFGVAHVKASPGRNMQLCVSIVCPCSCIESDGVEPWPGSEKLLQDSSRRPSQDALEQTVFQLGRRRRLTPATKNSIPCPYCDALLATSKARQCFVCGTDWHNPYNVICRTNAEWNRLGLQRKEMYVLEFCQSSDGARLTRFRMPSDLRGADQIFETSARPGWQWVAVGRESLASQLGTTTGEVVTFDGHGMWLTFEELRGIHRAARGEISRSGIAWSTKSPPAVPPK